MQFFPNFNSRSDNYNHIYPETNRQRNETHHNITKRLTLGKPNEEENPSKRSSFINQLCIYKPLLK